ncbi:MAG TPA: NAD(P)H-dependent oxidoreductase [Thermomicrobiales bacterium]|jgi:NAD(P)H-dependent FMN reductase|nr:NAD(P)H-dependent oxidoreductase [Thermomicrobiales bacterium]
MPRIGIILSSTRPNRNGEQVANWVLETARQRGDAEYELIDLRAFDLPNYDEPFPASMHQYQNEHTKRWAETIDAFDGFVIVTPEYNHSLPGSLKNALDFIYAEWNNKAVGFVSYGSVGGARAVEHLRQIVGHLQMADVGQTVSISLFTEFEDMQVFKPSEISLNALNTMLDQLASWTNALMSVRTQAVAAD